MSVDIPFVPETRTKIFDSVVEEPVEVRDVMLDLSRPTGEQLSVFLAPLRLQSEYELTQWQAQYEASGWESNCQNDDPSITCPAQAPVDFGRRIPL